MGTRKAFIAFNENKNLRDRESGILQKYLPPVSGPTLIKGLSRKSFIPLQRVFSSSKYSFSLEVIAKLLYLKKIDDFDANS
jgi:hypothetical protein